MNIRCTKILPNALILLVIPLLLAPGCADSEATSSPAEGGDPGRALACVQSDADTCGEASGCQWVGGVGCLSNEALPGAQLPKGFVFDEAYDGSLVPGDALIGADKEQKSAMYVLHYDDGTKVCGEFTVALNVDGESARLYFSVEGRVLHGEVAIALSNPRCIPEEGSTLCKRVYGDGDEFPEKFLTRAYLDDDRLVFTPALPVRDAREQSKPRFNGRSLFDSSYMRPHDGFKPSEVSAIEGCGE